MAEAGTQGPAPVDLERELTCSVSSCLGCGREGVRRGEVRWGEAGGREGTHG